MISSVADMESVPASYVSDCISLLSGKAQGHMEKWEYCPPLFPGDLAAGEEHWSALVKKPGKYYPAYEDERNIRHTVKLADFRKYLDGIETIVEFGPGCEDSLTGKTLPLLEEAASVRKYIALDSTDNIALMATRFISGRYKVDTGSVIMDFIASPLQKKWHGRSAVIMWGISLGNFPGGHGSDSFPKLVSMLGNIAKGLSSGDCLFASFDTETDGEKVLASYNEPNLKKQVLSILYRLARDGIAQGKFNPEKWRHEPVWVAKTLQCAHYVYPIIDQHFWIDGNEFSIPAMQRFISNNSYKYLPETIMKASAQAGFSSAEVFRNGPMAMLAAVK